MAKQNYYALPGVEWVNGARVPSNRVVSLTPEEAAFDLALNRVVLGTSLPPGLPPEPVLISTDQLQIQRSGRAMSLTVEDLVSYLSEGGVSPSLLLSTKIFQTGVSSGAILAAITAPAGWALTAETTFGGRVAVAGRNLVAAQALASAASGTARIRASSPDGLNAIVRTFDLSVQAPAADVTAPMIVSSTVYTVAENTPLTINLQASETVSWAKVGGADPLAFVLTGSTVTFGAKDFEAPTDTGTNNVYSASFTATDAAGNVSPFDLIVTVTDVVETPADTTAPTITSAAVATVAENAAFSLALTANEAVTWSKNGGADASLFTLVGSTLTMAAKDYEVPGDAGADNVYTVIVRATDAAGNATDQTINVTVTNVLEGTLATITPTTGTADNSAAASAVVLDLPALVEGETRSYIVTTGPAFTFNSAGDLIRGIATIAAGTATGKVRQTRGGVNTDTNVSITLTAGGGPLPSLYLGQVATRSYIPNALNATFKQFNSRSPHFARDTITSLQVELANWCCDQSANNLEKGSGGTAAYAASIEYPVGTFTQLFFGGAATSPAIADGAKVLSDAAAVMIPEGALFWVRVYCVASAAIVYVSNATSTPTTLTPRDTVNGQTFEFSSGALTNKTMGGTIPQSSTSSCYMPVAIVTQTRKASVFIHGDSRVWWANDTIDASGDGGEIARSIGPSFGYINTAGYGDRAANQLSGAFDKRGALAQYCSHVISEIGINELNGSAANLRARKNSLFATYFAGKTIYETTITPRSTGTFGTGGSQTTDATFNANRIAYNDSLRAGNAANVAGYFEVADVVETARNSGIWKDNYTDDGVHGLQLSNLAIKNSGAINPAVLVRAA